MLKNQILIFIGKLFLSVLIYYRRQRMSSGYDFSSKHPFRLIQGRLGVYDKPPYEGSSVEGVNNTATRLRQNGGNRQQERMITSKRRTLDRVVWNSYQGAEIVKNTALLKKPVRALINPNKLKQDYDDKILSVGYEYEFKPGDVFEWLGTHTYWLIYLQDLTELAYFKGDIRKCSYQIEWLDGKEKKSTYAAIRGPVETRINYIQKHEISVDIPNYSLNILMPKNEDTLKYFKRYSKFYLQGLDTCWRVEAIDSISMPGILEVVAVEYYANETEDDVKNGLVGGLIVKPIDEKPTTADGEHGIIGETFIYPKKEYEYQFTGYEIADWYVDKSIPVKIVIDEEDSKKIHLIWKASMSGQFDLIYSNYKKTIVVQSLF